MQHPEDKLPFGEAMKRLSTALSTELTAERISVFWDALSDLRIEDVTFACQHAARHWRPTAQERDFPTPATLREYAQLSRDIRLRQANAAAQAEARQQERTLLAQWSETPDAVGLAAIRQILRKLGDDMTMTHPVYKEPSTEDPEKRKAALREQVQFLNGEQPSGKVDAQN